MSTQLQQILTEQLHTATSNRGETHQCTAKGALATTRTSHHTKGFACLQLEVDAIHRFQPGGIPGWTTQVVPTAQFLHSQHRVAVWCFRGPASLPCPGRRKQSLSNSGAGVGQHHVAAVDLHDAATIQDRHALAPAMGHGQIVGDQQQRAAELLAQLSQSSHHLASNGHIKAGGWLVRDHQRRAQGDGQGNGQALAHAAAELMRIGAEAVGTDAHLLQQLLGSLEAFCVAHVRPVGAQCVQQMSTHGHQGVQACHRILKNQSHRPAAQ